MVLSAALIVCRFTKNKLVILVVLCVYLFSCTSGKKTEKETLPFYNSPQFDAEWIAESDSNYSKIHSIDTFSLTNQSGHTITKDSLDGKIYIANFFFTSCPGICPKMTNNLKVLQDSFANNPLIKLVSFSVMPWIDSVKKLDEYAKLNNIHSYKWHLLTGSKNIIYTLGRQSYFAEKNLGLKKDSSEFLHTESMLLIDKKGRIRGIYNATQKTDVQRVIDDIGTLLKD